MAENKIRKILEKGLEGNYLVGSENKEQMVEELSFLSEEAQKRLNALNFCKSQIKELSSRKMDRNIDVGKIELLNKIKNILE